jgi:hypothetical protein
LLFSMVWMVIVVRWCPMSFTQVLQILTAHPDVHRVHKLLYWVYKGQWPETMTCLYQHPLDGLLKKLVQRTPSLAVLERRLYKAAAALTKPEEYQQIAVLILDAAALLYPDAIEPDALGGIAPMVEPTRLATMVWDEEAASPITALALEDAALQEEAAPTFVLMPDLMPEEGATPALVILPEPEAPVSLPTVPVQEDTVTTPNRPSLERFALRQFLMQQAPPLKIKILLFSALRHSFTFTPEDWKVLKTQTLDVWLTELLETFPTIEVLEQQLFAQAASLKTLDQSIQIAETIVQAVRLQAH